MQQLKRFPLLRSILCTLLILAFCLVLGLPVRAEAQTGVSGQAARPAQPQGTDEAEDKDTYSKEEIYNQMDGFFAGTSQGLAEIIEKVFAEQGRPRGFIKGTEGSGAFVVGLRYGKGSLEMKNGQKRRVWWQGPSVGFDWGGNAAKVFVLVYNMRNAQDIYRRFPGVDGSAYLIGGFGVNYQQNGHIILAPIRTGVGLRLGGNVGYLHYTETESYIPF